LMLSSTLARIAARIRPGSDDAVRFTAGTIV
jgi:hypothetical protein